MKDYAESFYKSKTWQKARAAYMHKVGGLCELCLAEGRITPAVIVHHKIPIDPETIKRPEIALAFDNMQALCRDHHAQQHAQHKRRYIVDELGRVSARD